MAATSNALQVLLQYVVDPSSAKAAQGQVQKLAQAISAQNVVMASPDAMAEESAAIAALRERTKLQLEMLELERRHGVVFQANLDASVDDLALQRQKVALLREQQQLANRQTQTDVVNRPPTFIQFSVFPVAQLFRSLGMNDISNRMMDAGAVLGLVDSLAILDSQLARLAANIRDSTGFIGTLSGAVRSIVPAFGSITAALVGVGVVAIPIVGVFAAISAALAENQRQAEESKKRIEEFTSAIEKMVGELAGGATSTELQDQAAEEQRRALAFQQAADRLRSAFEYIDSLGKDIDLPEGVDATNIDQFIQTYLEDLSDQFGVSVQSVPELTAVIEALGKSADEATASADAYTAASRTDMAVQNERIQQIRDQIAVEQQERDARSATIQMRIEAQRAEREAAREAGRQYALTFVDAQSEATEILATQTGEQVAGMRERWIRELDTINAKIDLTTGKERERYEAEATRISALLQLLGGVTLTTTDFENAKKQTEEYRQQIKELTADFQRQARQLAEERAISARREAEDFGRSRERTLEAEARAMAREDRDRARRQEREQKEAARRFEDFLKRIRQIIEDFALRMSEAVAERDALAFVRAKRERDKQLKEEDENYKEAEKRREEDLKDEQDYFEESRRERIEDFQRRLREEDDDRALRLRRQVEDYQRRDLIEQDNFNRRRQQLFNQLSFEAQIYQATANQATFYINYITSSFISGLQAMAQYTATAFTGGGTTTPDHGSPWAGWGAMTARGSGSMTINVAGAQQRTIEATSRQVALSTFDRVLTDMGL